MASKQLGKLRQWAGEVISSRDKTVVTDEFRELEHDIELRRQGLWKLHITAEDYQSALSKKKESEALDEPEKLLPVDALGIVMIRHGEEFGEESAYGTSLVSMGRAHCKIATLQETFAMTFEDTFLASIHRSEDEIKEYQIQRKKLDSRRLSYDAAISKLEKVRNSKKEKEKDKKEAEDEFAKAKSRYEETAEDVRVRMYAIQENEVAQLRDLTALLALETNFVEQYLEVLRDVKAGWVDEATMTRLEMARPKGPMHMFARSPDDDPRFGSVRSTQSASKKSARRESSDASSSEEEASASRPRGLSLSRRKSEASSKAPSRPPSRPQSRASRKRADSEATAPGDKDKDKDEEKDKAEKHSRKKSVAGWASTAASAVSSVTGRGKKDKDKDTFAALRDEHGTSGGEEESDDWGRPSSVLSSSSRRSKHHKSRSSVSTPGTSPKVPVRTPKSPYGVPHREDGRKMVMALHDFAAGSTDELSFRAGDRIVVVNEVLDGWWMGELGDKRGLFPTTYTEVLPSTSSVPSIPPLPQRPPAMSRGAGASAPPVLTVDTHESKDKYVDARDDFDMSGSDDEHPFGDHHLADSQSPSYGRFGSGDPSSGGEDEEERLVPARRPSEVDEDINYREPPSPVRRPADLPNNISSVKKPPPPPPPRRMTTSGLTAPTPPPIPSRPATLHSKSSQSSSTSFVAVAATPTIPSDANGLTHSPFDSPGDSW